MENKKTRTKKEKNTSLESLIKVNDEESINEYKALNWSGTFWDYLAMVEDNPKLARN